MFMRGTPLFLRRITPRAKVLAPPAMLLLAAACAAPHDTSMGETWGRDRLRQGAANAEILRCTEAFITIDKAVDRAGTRDVQAVPIRGFPYLRTNRFLAALGPRFLATGKHKYSDKAFSYWVAWLAQTATQARGYELANLSKNSLTALRGRLDEDPKSVIAECTAALMGFDGKKTRFRKTLAGVVTVPDNYTDIFRVMGFYPLTSIAVVFGFNRWKDRNLTSFQRPVSALKTVGRVGYAAPAANSPPPRPGVVAALLRGPADNPLNISRPSASRFRRLAAAFAPIFAVDVAGKFDRIGSPVLVRDGAPRIDETAKQVFVQQSWAIIDGEPHLQISYLVWFSERPPTGSLDILSGKLDGLIWRVTLALDGRPLLYDSIHPCGCYHLFFPAPPMRPRDHPVDDPREGTVVPAAAPVLGPGRRMVLHISSGDHYLRGLSVSNGMTATPTRYQLVPMDQLRSLPAPDGGRRSLYGRDGIIAGTERSERWILWPMGIPSPGAMRQWGTHATAFVGRRHFDDPYLIDKAFTR
jgi:hypothetical protein